MKKNIVITGAFSAIGSTITLSLLQNGHQVFAVVGPDEDPNSLQHPCLEVFKINLMNACEGLNLVNVLTDLRKVPIHAVICAEMECLGSNLKDTSFADIQHMIDTNFKTLYHIAHPLFSVHRESGESLELIFVGSRSGMKRASGKSKTAYALSQSLVLQLAEHINEDTCETGIRASVVTPSAWNIASNRSALSERALNRFVTLNDVNRYISFILSGAGISTNEQVCEIFNTA